MDVGKTRCILQFPCDSTAFLYHIRVSSDMLSLLRWLHVQHQRGGGTAAAAPLLFRPDDPRAVP